MSSPAHGLEQAQLALIEALDAHDAQAIETAVQSLTAAVEQLGASGAIYANQDIRADFDRLEKLADAASYRITLLQQQTRRRLEMLHDQDKIKSQTYSRPAARIVEA
ncbi:MAG: hypothetical protein AAFX04_10475 [Pseudomonadota bacterium]